jgi:hypothetical protein
VVAWQEAPAAPVAEDRAPPKGRFGLASRLKAALRPRPQARPTLADTEARMLGKDVERLSATAVRPAAVEPAQLAKLNPYFVLFFGVDADLEAELQGAAKGLALVQRDGWSPEYGGADALAWALHHRDLTHVGATIQVAGDGAVVRRAGACMAYDDDLSACVVRSAALGADLMGRVVADVIAGKPLEGSAPYAAGAAARGPAHAAITDDVTALLDGGFIARAMAQYQTF